MIFCCCTASSFTKDKAFWPILTQHWRGRIFRNRVRPLWIRNQTIPNLSTIAREHTKMLTPLARFLTVTVECVACVSHTFRPDVQFIAILLVHVNVTLFHSPNEKTSRSWCSLGAEGYRLLMEWITEQAGVQFPAWVDAFSRSTVEFLHNVHQVLTGSISTANGSRRFRESWRRLALLMFSREDHVNTGLRLSSCLSDFAIPGLCSDFMLYIWFPYFKGAGIAQSV
jgi:hypothetical protein